MSSFQKILLFLFFSIPIVGFSQNQFLDFAINQENDTIFGVIKDGFKEKSVLHEFNTNYKKDKIKFTQLIDPKGFDANAALQFGVDELPSKYLFNPEGILIAKNPSEEEIMKLIKS